MVATSILPSENVQSISQNAHNGNTIFIPSMLTNKPTIPKQFLWPKSETTTASAILDAPTIDLKGILTGDASLINDQIDSLHVACKTHGFFLVVNHGIDSSILNATLDHATKFFTLPSEEKLNIVQKKGSMAGYSGAHSERFSEKLPWKECLSFSSGGNIVEFMTSSLGKEFEKMGQVYQRYCEAMRKLSLSIMELLGSSLGVGKYYYRDFFQDCSYIMRCNYYPSCPEPQLTQGTGPHSDTVALTILQQEEVVRGLEVFTGGMWQTIVPVPGSLVINIGDTFMAMTNGIYKSCVHRAVVNQQFSRRSIAFFVCPRSDKVVQAHDSLIGPDGKRLYPDFTWSQLMEFTQKYHRADEKTLECFTQHLLGISSSK